MSLEAVHASADPSTVGPAAADAVRAIRDWTGQPSRAAALREYITRFQRAYGQRLTIDGTYGRNTREALHRITDTPIAELPAITTRPTPATRPTATEPPGRLATAIALAHWTADAVADDATAARVLAALNSNAAVSAVRAADVSGEVGHSVPDAPSSDDALTRARAAWERARAAGASAARDLDARARAAVAEGERALRQVRLALDRETDTVVRQALAAVEAGLTAILRPLSRGIATAVRPVAGAGILIGLAALAYMLGSKR